MEAIFRYTMKDKPSIDFDRLMNEFLHEFPIMGEAVIDYIEQAYWVGYEDGQKEKAN